MGNAHAAYGRLPSFAGPSTCFQVTPMNKPWAIVVGLCGLLAGAATDRFVFPHTSVDAVDRLAFPNRSIDTITLLRTAGFSEGEIRAYCIRETSAPIDKRTRTTWPAPPAMPPRR